MSEQGAVSNAEIADLFHEIADILEIRDENVFRIRAYRRAAEQIEGLPESAASLVEAGRKIPGVGSDLAAKIREAAATGTIGYLEELRRTCPSSVRQLLALPGIGPRSARALFERLGIDSIDKLEEACRSGAILEAPGFSEKTRANLLRGIAGWRASRARVLLADGLAKAAAFTRALSELEAVRSIEVAGSLRRRCETVGGIDLLAVSERPAEVLEAFASLPRVRELLGRGERRASAKTREGVSVHLGIAEPAAGGAAFVAFTGSADHLLELRDRAARRGLRLAEEGVFDENGGRVAGASEQEVYGILGLPWIPPELREGTGEVAAAESGALPRLVAEEDIKGDLHAHTDWSDGRLSLEELVAAAAARGYEYLVVSDHSQSTTIARGLTPERVRQQIEEIRKLQQRHRIRILTGTECDILPDGSLDLPDDLLAELDVVLVAVHSRFQQSREEMTARICRALGNRHARVLAHPTGRLLGSRRPYDVDLEQVLATARQNGKAVEINASPHRLDLGDVPARRAGQLGVAVSIDTDAHSLKELDNVWLGVAVARRAWLGAESIVNTWPLDRLLEWAHAGR